MSAENNENITKPGSNFSPTFVHQHLLSYINFNGHCLMNNIYIPKKGNKYIYISYALNQWLRNLSTDFTLNNCLFEFAKITKNGDPDKCKYSCYGKGFDSRS